MPRARSADCASDSPDAPASRRLEAWFAQRGWEAFAFQREAWAAYLAGKSGLVHAPTGIGKTLAVWGGPLLEGLKEEARGALTPLRVLWITPLRALAADTLQALREPSGGLGLGWAIEARTGDTSQSQKARQKARLPAALVTTPESLSLLLTYPETRERMATLRAVIVDEWHELLGTKRGVQTELCLARLRGWLPELRVWGLSATIGNLEEAKAVLLGPAGAARGVVVSGKTPKRVEIETLIPEAPGRFPWSGHLGTRMLAAVIGRIEGAGTTLLFTNTRSQTEIWHQALAEARPEWGATLAMHHGSLEREIREEVEARLRAGTVRCVVCTSSLDLGVDFSPVEQVLQLGSPKGVARLMQRAGRSGHQPGATSRVIGVPTNAFELVEFAAARDAIGAGKIESRPPMEGALDVLAQHLVTVAVGGGFMEEAMRAEARSTHAFRDLGDEEWAWVLEFVTSGGPALRAYPDYRKVVRGGDGHYRVEDRRMAQLHRMNIGTITSATAVAVRMTNGKRLGTVEEGFISRMKAGDQFIFAGCRLELVRFREMTADVRPPARKKGNMVPRWGGGKSPLSSELAEAVLAKMGETDAPGPEMRAAREILDIQRAWSRVPQAGELLVESTDTDEGRQFFVYPFAGRLVHEGLATLSAFRLSRAQGRAIHTAFNDYGFSLLAEVPLGMDEDAWREIFRTDRLLVDLLDCMNAAELGKRQFRGIARVAGLVLQGYPGKRKTARALQVSAGLLYDVFSKYDPDNLLLAQAQRELLERQLEIGRLRDTLARMAAGAIVRLHTARLTPLAFPLWADRISQDTVNPEGHAKRLERMLAELESAAGRKDAPEFRPEVGMG